MPEEEKQNTPEHDKDDFNGEPAQESAADEETTDLPADELNFEGQQDAETPEAEAETEPEIDPEIQQLKEKADQRDEYYDKWLRAHADLANFRQRAKRTIAAASAQGVQTFAQDLLPALDDFERALRAAEEAHDFEQLVQGVRLAEDSIHDVLKQHGLEPIDAAKGVPFDPTQHEAIATQPAADVDDGVIVEEVRRGYRHGKRVIRASQVVVARNPEPEKGEEADGSEREQSTDEEDEG